MSPPCLFEIVVASARSVKTINFLREIVHVPNRWNIAFDFYKNGRLCSSPGHGDLKARSHHPLVLQSKRLAIVSTVSAIGANLVRVLARVP